MAAVFLRMLDMRFEGVDMCPDFLGGMFILTAVYILCKCDNCFKKTRIWAQITFILSFSTLIEFLPETPQIAPTAVYIGLRAALLAFECVTFNRILDAFCVYYKTNRKHGKAVALYAVGQAAFTLSAVGAYIFSDSGSFLPTAVFLVCAAINVVTATYLAYNFYVMHRKKSGDK